MAEENDKNSEGQEVEDKEKTHPETADASKNLDPKPQKDHTKRDPVEVKEQTEPKKLEVTEESPVNLSSETRYKEQSDLDTTETLEDLASQIITKEHKPRTLMISIMITIGLFVGPIFLIIDLLSQETFSFLQGNSRMIFSFTTLLYFGGSIISAKNRVVELDE